MSEVEGDMKCNDRIIGSKIDLINGKSGIICYVGESKDISNENKTIIGIKLNEWTPNTINYDKKHEMLYDIPNGYAYFMELDAFKRKYIMKSVKLNNNGYGIIKGLVKSAQFNGEIVKTEHFVEAKSRWKAKSLKQNKTLFVKADNLKPILYNEKTNKITFEYYPLNNNNNQANIDCLTKYPVIGDMVKTKYGQIGCVKYVGNVEFEDNDTYIGIELSEWNYNANNGTVNDVSYFNTKNGHGYFTKLSDLIGNMGQQTPQTSILYYIMVFLVCFSYYLYRHR